MSGPKISIYSLSGRARELLRGQIQCDRESAICISQIEHMLEDLVGIDSELSKSLAVLELLQRKTGGKECEIEEVKSLLNSINRDVANIKETFRKAKPRITGNYQITETAYSAKQVELQKIKAVNEKLNSLYIKANRARSLGREEGKKEQRRAQQIIVEYLSEKDPENSDTFIIEDPEVRRKQIAEDISAVTSFEEIAVVQPQKETGLDVQKQLVLEKLEALFELPLPNDLITETNNLIARLKVINTKTYLETFEKVSVKGLCQRIEEYQTRCAADLKQYIEKAEQYKALNKLINGESVPIPQFRDTEELESAIADLERTLINQQEQVYISESVDEVLSEMGYDLIGRREVTKRSGKKFRNELYEFDEGTAVNVTYSSDGQISMELGGIAREDRIPSEAESDILTDDMKEFCKEFAVFEKKLRERGILVGNRIALMPPDAEYATIINIEDYDIAENKNIIEISKKTKRRKTTENRLARNGDT